MTETAIASGATSTAISTFAPELTNENGQITTTSLQVAQHFGRAHNLVMRSIRNLECSDDFRLRNFAQSSYANEQGKQQPMYHITKDGFVFLAMGFTGKEAAQWKEAYITAFNKMEAELVKLAQPEPCIPYSVQPGDKLTAAQAATLRVMLDDACKELAKNLQPMFMQKGWAKLKSHFGVTYRQIPAQEFTEAVSLVSRHIVSFQATKVSALPAPEPMPTKLSPAMLVSLINGGCLAESAVRDIAMASTNYLFMGAARSPSGYGDEVRRRIDDKLPMADLHAIVVAATMEMQLRVHGYDIAQQGRA